MHVRVAVGFGVKPTLSFRREERLLEAKAVVLLVKWALAWLGRRTGPPQSKQRRNDELRFSCLSYFEFTESAYVLCICAHRAAPAPVGMVPRDMAASYPM